MVARQGDMVHTNPAALPGSEQGDGMRRERSVGCWGWADKGKRTTTGEQDQPRAEQGW